MTVAHFQPHFARYLVRARQAREQDQHHDQRRQLFLDFLKDAFEIGAADVEVEQYVQIASKQVSAKGIARINKGWIDAAFGELIFEFKRDLKRERTEGLRELADYLSTIPNGAECIGLLTDGLEFLPYQLDASQPSGLRESKGIDLGKLDPQKDADVTLAYLWFDAYLLKQKSLPPTSADLVQRFGLNSPTFVTSAQQLRAALAAFGSSEGGALTVKRQQWAFYLARVYGSADANNDDLFVRHTYLCQFAKILAYTARFGVAKASADIERVIDGRAFEALGVSNIGEQDFFAWVLAPEVREGALTVFRKIAALLVAYDLSRIDEDLLKQLYQNLVEPETRHELGEFYTPDWLAELTLREIGYRPGKSLLDPACGSGAFLFTAIRLLAEQGLTGSALVEFALDNIMGMDVHPLAVTIAKITSLLAILPHLADGGKKGQRAIPIALANSLQQPSAANRTFDVVASNPPWIAYRYLRDAGYQQDVKALTRQYGLLAASDVKLITQMELSTLFFEHCRAVYLQPGGTIAFVMPRSVLTGAKQHRAFQDKGFSRVLDLKEVAPLFGVETCVMIRQGSDALTQAIPTARFAGKLRAHECKWAEASTLLTRSAATTSFARQQAIASPYYYPRMINGATLYPRNLCFVTSAQPDLASGALAHTSIMRSDPHVNDEAKVPWKGLALAGHIDDLFLYATLLSKQLVPFGARRLHLVALPIKVGIPRGYPPVADVRAEERFLPISLDEMREPFSGLDRSADAWFAPAERLWQKYKKSTTKETLADWLNYQNKVTGQSAAPGSILVYNASGSNIASALLDTQRLPVINSAQPRALVVDHTTYWYRCATPEEGYYLSAMLNAPCVDAAIKAHQPRGLFGVRHITRLPFEVCPIPQYDPDDADHQQLAALSQAAHATVARLDLSTGSVVAARKQARQAAHAHLAEIDLIAQRLLGLAPAALPAADDERDDADDEETSA